MIRDKKNLVVYHGTAQKVQTPDLSRTRGQKDFGVGFYLTTDKPQASQFAKRQSYVEHTKEGYINCYNMTNFDGLKVLEFEKADVNWLKFICNNRGKRVFHHEYDVVLGKIADDNTRVTLDQYMAGQYNSYAAKNNILVESFVIELLQTDNLKNQLCLCSDRAIKKLKFLKATVVR